MSGIKTYIKLFDTSKEEKENIFKEKFRSCNKKGNMKWFAYLLKFPKIKFLFWRFLR